MPIQIVKAISYFIDWFDKVRAIKKIYALITIQAIGLYFLLKYYNNQLNDINTIHNNRIHSLILFYNNKLEECNSENKAEYTKIIQILNHSLEAQKELQIESEMVKLESERIKVSLMKK